MWPPRKRTALADAPFTVDLDRPKHEGNHLRAEVVRRPRPVYGPTRADRSRFLRQPLIGTGPLRGGSQGSAVHVIVLATERHKRWAEAAPRSGRWPHGGSNGKPSAQRPID